MRKGPGSLPKPYGQVSLKGIHVNSPTAAPKSQGSMQSRRDRRLGEARPSAVGTACNAFLRASEVLSDGRNKDQRRRMKDGRRIAAIADGSKVTASATLSLAALAEKAWRWLESQPDMPDAMLLLSSHAPQRTLDVRSWVGLTVQREQPRCGILLLPHRPKALAIQHAFTGARWCILTMELRHGTMPWSCCCRRAMKELRRHWTITHGTAALLSTSSAANWRWRCIQ